jgi:hypothetical protein
MKKSRWSILILLFLVVFFLALFYFISFSNKARIDGGDYMSLCLSRNGTLGDLLLLYAKEHGTFPKSSKKEDPYYWISALEGYFKTHSAYHDYLVCVKDPDQTIPSSYISDPKLAGMSLKEFKFPERTVILRERGYFHYGKAIYFFANETRKWIKKDEVPKNLLFNPVEYEMKE